jgi:hypothetical protein
MSKCTKGPWAYAPSGAKGSRPELATVAFVGAFTVGVPTPGYPGGDYRYIDCPDPEGESDARLIAAAPQMAEARQSLADMLAVTYQSRAQWPPGLCDAYAALKAAGVA